MSRPDTIGPIEFARKLIRALPFLLPFVILSISFASSFLSTGGTVRAAGDNDQDVYGGGQNELYAVALWTDGIEVSSTWNAPTETGRTILNEPPVMTPNPDVRAANSGEELAWIPVLSDPQSNPVTLTLAGPNSAMGGTVSWDGTMLRYTSLPGYAGTDSIVFRLTDGVGGISMAEVQLNVTNPFAAMRFMAGAMANNRPDATNSAQTVIFGLANQTITMNATDPDVGDVLTYSVYQAPIHGTLGSVSGNTITYTPNANYNGPDGFAFLVDDGSGGVDVAYVSITVSYPPVSVNYYVDNTFWGNHVVYGSNGVPVDTTGLSEGLHTFRIEATDAGGGTANAQGTFHVDNTPPTIVWRQHPGFPSTVMKIRGNMNVRVQVQDNQSTPTDDHIDAPTVRLQMPSGALVEFSRDSTFPPGAPEPYIWGILNLSTVGQPQGLRTFTARASDRAGNVTNPPITFDALIDNGPPTVSAVTVTPAPQGASSLVKGLITVSATATDALTNVTSMKLYLVGATEILLDTEAGPSITHQFNTASYGDGPFTLRVEAFDEAVDTISGLVGNKGTSTRAITIDNTAPAVDITSPADGASLVSVSEIVATANDLHGIQARRVEVKRNAEPFADYPMTFVAPDRWVFATPLDDAGTFVIKAIAEDGVGTPGNAGSDQITVNLSGIDDPPTGSAGPDQTVNERALVQLAGSGSDEEGAVSFIWSQVSGPTVGLSATNIAAPTFTAPYVNANQVIRLKLRVTDLGGQFVEDTVDITVQNGAFGNQNPTANAGPDQTVTERALVQLAGSGSDPESGAITYLWSQVSGPSVTLSATNIANPTFTAPYVNSSQVIRLKLRVTDDQAAFTEDVIDVTVQNGAFGNVPPTSNAGPDQTVTERTAVQLAGSGSDPESGPLTYAWSQVSGPSVTLSNAGIANPTFTAPYVNASQVVRLRLRVTDDQGAFLEDTMDVTVQNGAFGNQPPGVNAGHDQTVNERAVVSLAGAGSDPESGPLTYLWSQVSGPSVTLSNNAVANPTFTAPYVNSNQVVRLRLRVTDDQGAFADDTVDVTVQNGAFGNQPPVSNAGPDQTVSERSVVSLSGSGSDPENGAVTYLWTQDSGPSVTLSNAGVANPTFTAPYVNSGQVVRLRLRVTDDQAAYSEDVIDVTVQNGAFGNQAPTSNAGPDQSVNERAVVSLSGSGSDPENGPLTYAWAQVSGPSVTLSNAGVANPTFTAPYVNSNQVVRLRLRVTDDQGAFADDTIDVTVQNGAFGNQTPSVNAGPDQTVNELTNVSLNGSASDPENGAITYLWSQVSGPSVSLSATNVPNPTFNAPSVAANSVIRLRLRATDDQGAFAEDTVDITVNDLGSGGDNPPTSDAGPDQSVNERALVQLAGSGSDVEGPVTYLWSQDSGPSVTLSATNIANPTFTAPYVNANQVIRLRLRVTDNQGAFADDTVDVTVQNGAFGNQAPTSNAGPDQSVNERAVVSLSGSGSDPENGPLTYAWAQVSGPSVTLSNASIANPTFTAPYVNANQVVRLRLRVTDDQGAFADDTIDVTVQNGAFGNQTPSVNAGPDQTVNELTNVSLNGSASDPENGAITYLWSQVSGPSVSLSATNVPNPTFNAPSVAANSVIRLRLRATDDQGAFAEDTVDITVNDLGSGGDNPPTSDAGPDQSVNERALVQLAGSGSDVEGPVTYAWSQVSGPAVSVSNPAIANPTFTAPYVNANQVVRLRLRVTDNQGAFADDTVDVTVQNGAFGNQNPTVDAGSNQSVNERAAVSLSGSASDPENGVITYLWSQVSGPSVSLSDTGIPNPTFTAPYVNANQVVRLRLRATDDQGVFVEDTVDITVLNGAFGNQSPSAGAGPDQTVDERDLVQLAGSGSDPESGALGYQWSQVSGPAVTLSATDVPSPTFTAPYVNSSQVVRLRLRVTDDQGAFAEDTVDVTVQNGAFGNQAPTSNAGLDQTVNELAGVALSGSGSDPESGVMSYLWSQVSGPAVTLSATNVPNPTFNAPSVAAASVVRLRLRVTDDQGAFADDVVDVTVNNVDNDTPVVAIVTPAANAFVRGVIPITMEATDDDGVAQAFVRIDGGGEVAANPSGLNLYTYTWNTNSLPEVPHTILAIARDPASVEGSQQITVTVDRTLPQAVTLVPADNATVQGTVAVQSQVTDDKSLVFVELMIDGTQVAAQSVSGLATVINYSWDTQGYSEGTHQVTVRAVDAAGNVRIRTHDVTVRNLGGANPLPDFNWTAPAVTVPPALTTRVRHITLLQIRVTVGEPVTNVQFSVDGSPLPGVVDNPSPGVYSYSFDTRTPLTPDGNHTFTAVVTNAEGFTSKSVTAFVDNTPPVVNITNPTVNEILFLVANLQATVDDNGLPIDEVEFRMNNQPIALRSGNSDPGNENYSFQWDTEAENADGSRRWPDSPSGQFNYTLKITAWDEARNDGWMEVQFAVDNTNIPTNPAAVVNFNPTGFVAGNAGNGVWAEVQNATIDPASFNQQGDRALQVRVRTDSSPTWRLLEMPVRLVGNRMVIDEPLPHNCRYQLTARVMDTNNKLIQGSVEGIKAIDDAIGASVSSADGLFTVDIPPNALDHDLYIEIPVMATRPNWMEQADLSFNQLYHGHSVVAGPYRIEGRTSMTGDALYDETLVADAGVRHRVAMGNIPPTQQSFLRQIQEVRSTTDSNFWHPLGTSSNQTSQDSSFRSVNGNTRRLGIFRVTMFAAPGTGVTEVFNYPNPVHPDEGPTTITYMLGDPSDVTIVIYDSLGNLVKKLQYAAGSPGGAQGPNSVLWDCRNGAGDVVASGSYIAQLIAKDSGGGRSKAIRKIGVVR